MARPRPQTPSQVQGSVPSSIESLFSVKGTTALGNGTRQASASRETRPNCRAARPPPISQRRASPHIHAGDLHTATCSSCAQGTSRSGPFFNLPFEGRRRDGRIDASGKRHDFCSGALLTFDGGRQTGCCARAVLEYRPELRNCRRRRALRICVWGTSRTRRVGCAGKSTHAIKSDARWGLSSSRRPMPGAAVACSHRGRERAASDVA